MTLTLNSRIKALVGLKKDGERDQRGGVSPFMFGLLVGMSIFSVMSAYWAQKELAALQVRQAERAQKQADDVVKALEFSALTETQSTYSDQYDMDRAKGSLARASGKTRGGEEYVVNAQEAATETFGTRDSKLVVTASDDTLLRAKVYQTGNADDVAAFGDGRTKAVATLDTGGIRQRQVLTSVKAMEALAEQVYAFYAGHMRFPTDMEFKELQAKFPYVDAWGGPFSYTRTGEDTGTLEFTTPWNYTQTLNMSLKE